MLKNLYRGIYLCLGYPNLAASLHCLDILKQHKNLDFIELGLPFSDPIADGKVIAQAAQHALQEAQKHGIRPQDMLTEAMKRLQTPTSKAKDIYLMTYANMIYYLLQEHQGFKQLALDGLIIPDLPLQEQSFFSKLGLKHPIISFATPESTTEDLKLLASAQKQQSRDPNAAKKATFIYFVAVRGITGAKTDFQNPELRQQYAAVCHATQKDPQTSSEPVVLGFGIRGKTEIDQVTEFADGYVIGTAAVELQNDPKAYQNFIDSL